MAWVETKKQRPEKDTFVLAFGPNIGGWVGGPNIAVYYWHSDLWWDANDDAEISDYAPTHWMPLPGIPGSEYSLPIGLSWSDGRFIYNTFCLNAKRKVVVQTDIESDDVLYLVYRDDREFVEECATLDKAMHVFNEV